MLLPIDPQIPATSSNNNSEVSVISSLLEGSYEIVAMLDEQKIDRLHTTKFGRIAHLPTQVSIDSCL